MQIRGEKPLANEKEVANKTSTFGLQRASASCMKPPYLYSLSPFQKWKKVFAPLFSTEENLPSFPHTPRKRNKPKFNLLQIPVAPLYKD